MPASWAISTIPRAAPSGPKQVSSESPRKQRSGEPRVARSDRQIATDLRLLRGAVCVLRRRWGWSPVRGLERRVERVRDQGGDARGATLRGGPHDLVDLGGG